MQFILPRTVTLLVDPDHQFHIGLDNVGYVVTGGDHTESLGGDDLGGLGTGKGQDLVLYDPVEVAILNLLEVLLLVDINV